MASCISQLRSQDERSDIPQLLQLHQRCPYCSTNKGHVWFDQDPNKLLSFLDTYCHHLFVVGYCLKPPFVSGFLTLLSTDNSRHLLFDNRSHPSWLLEN